MAVLGVNSRAASPFKKVAKKEDSDGNGVIFADYSVGWHLARNSRNCYVRLLMEISPHTFFLKKYFDPMEKCVFQ